MNRILSFLLLACSLHGATYYVSTTGSSGNSGAIGSPWDIASALTQASHSVAAGDTIYLRGGTYSGYWVSTLSGSNGNPIKVRAYTGERPILDSGTTDADTQQGVIKVDSASHDTWFWGLEFINSNTGRVSSMAGSDPSDIHATDGINVFGTRIKVINCIMHDTRQGIGFWIPGVDSEVYGNLIYYNGYDSTVDGGHGHGIYMQNAQSGSTKHVLENILFQQFGHGIHGYSQEQFVDHFDIQGNIAFQSGRMSAQSLSVRNILVGAGTTANANTLNANYAWYLNTDGSTEGVNLGLDSNGCSNMTVTNNYFVGGYSALNLPNCNPSPMSGNFIDGPLGNFVAGDHPGNTYYSCYQSNCPSGLIYAVRPNAYETGRANIVVYNFDLSNSVSISLAGSGLTTGQAYEIRDVQNYFGSPIFTGTYSASNISLPMNSTAVAVAIGTVPHATTHTSKQFGAFIVLPTASASGSGGTQVTGKVTLSGKVTQ